MKKKNEIVFLYFYFYFFPLTYFFMKEMKKFFLHKNCYLIPISQFKVISRYVKSLNLS